MEREIEANANGVRESRFSIDQAKTYSLAEQIDLAEAHNPETRVAWERARAQAAALGVARSELYPTLAAAALSHTYRSEDLVGTRFFRQTIQDFQGGAGSELHRVRFRRAIRPNHCREGGGPGG
jgi:outer membrane protein